MDLLLGVDQLLLNDHDLGRQRGLVKHTAKLCKTGSLDPRSPSGFSLLTVQKKHGRDGEPGSEAIEEGG